MNAIYKVDKKSSRADIKIVKLRLNLKTTDKIFD